MRNWFQANINVGLIDYCAFLQYELFLCIGGQTKAF